MATKTITIMDDAYAKLKRSKLPGESFTDVINRVLPEKRSIMDFFGAWDEETASIVEASIKESRERSRKHNSWGD
jgi:predicted CopG family antitoxin